MKQKFKHSRFRANINSGIQLLAMYSAVDTSKSFTLRQNCSPSIAGLGFLWLHMTASIL